ncbi:phage head completion protein [Beijerinckia mobilis]|uniref:phage head completion protein n=1 Tax=Beijerinckia mobilis TaxID=231434 RepID=UPI000558193E|nr:head-tail adaptor protein [Beijerinckia mobilis]
MNAGDLEHILLFKGPVYNFDEAGASITTYEDRFMLRAKMVENSQENQSSDSGTRSIQKYTFQTRFKPVAYDYHVILYGKPHEIENIEVIGRRKGLNITVKEIK